MAEESFSRAESAAAVEETRLDNGDVLEDIAEEIGIVKPKKKQCLYSGAKCCCGGNLRTICVIIGAIEVILIVADCYFYFSQVPKGDTIDYESQKIPKTAPFPLGIGILVVWGLYILCLIAAAVLLVVGAWIRKKLLVVLHSILLAVAFVLMLGFLTMFILSYGTAISHIKETDGTLANFLWIMPAIGCGFWGLKALAFYIYFAIVGGGLYTHYRAGQMFDGKFMNFGSQKYNYNAGPGAPAPPPPEYQYQQQQPQEQPQAPGQSQPQSQYQSQQQLPKQST